MKPHKWLVGSLIVLCQFAFTVHGDAASKDDDNCMKNDQIAAAESLGPMARDSGGKLLVLLQCGRANPGRNTRAFIVGPELEPVLEEGVSDVHWMGRGMVLAERLNPALLPRREFEWVAVSRPWKAATSKAGLEPMRSVSVDSEGTEIVGIIVSPTGANSIAAFQMKSYAAVRVPLELPESLRGVMYGAVVLDKQSRRLAFSPMIYDESVMSNVNRTFLLDRRSEAVTQVELQQSRPLFFADNKVFVVDGSGALTGCDVESGTCSMYFSFSSEHKRVESAVAVGHGQAVALIRDLRLDPFDIRSTEIVLVDLATNTIRSRTVLPEGLRMRSVDWIQN